MGQNDEEINILCINDEPMISSDKALFLDTPGITNQVINSTCVFIPNMDQNLYSLELFKAVRITGLSIASLSCVSCSHYLHSSMVVSIFLQTIIKEH